MEKDTITQLICKICGGPLRDDGVFLECLACGAKYESRAKKSQNEVMLYNAFDELRKGEFEEAADSFGCIISKDKNRAPKPERRRPEAIWNRCESADDSPEKVCGTKRKSCFADKFQFV